MDAPTFGSMTEKTDKKRDPPISYRPPADLADEFRRRVEQSGLSVNAYITRAVFNAPIPRGARTPAAEKRMLAHLLGHSAAIRDALDSASRSAGEDVYVAAAIERAHEELSVIRAAILKLLEREP